jgi:hypothetical protein
VNTPGGPTPRAPSRTAAERLGDEGQTSLHGGPEVGIDDAQLGPSLSGGRVFEEAGPVSTPGAGELLIAQDHAERLRRPTRAGPARTLHLWPGRGHVSRKAREIPNQDDLEGGRAKFNAAASSC